MYDLKIISKRRYFIQVRNTKSGSLRQYAKALVTMEVNLPNKQIS